MAPWLTVPIEWATVTEPPAMVRQTDSATVLAPAMALNELVTAREPGTMVPDEWMARSSTRLARSSANCRVVSKVARVRVAERIGIQALLVTHPERAVVPRAVVPLAALVGSSAVLTSGMWCGHRGSGSANVPTMPGPRPRG
jgi:hypothetical protein